MKLPWESARARWRWSIAAVIILLVWQYGILAAGATQFPVKYDPTDIPRAIGTAGSEPWWPGEFGRYSRWWMRILQVAPLLGVACWSMVLVPWRVKRHQLLALTGALLIPGWSIVLFPHMLVLGPLVLPLGLFGSWTGEEYQDGIIMYPAMAAWCWFMMAVLAVTIFRKRVVRPECQRCGYSTIGLTTGVCPECGAVVAHVKSTVSDPA